MLCPLPTKEPNQKATEDKAEPSHQIEELPDEAPGLSMATVLVISADLVDQECCSYM